MDNWESSRTKYYLDAIFDAALVGCWFIVTLLLLGIDIEKFL